MRLSRVARLSLAVIGATLAFAEVAQAQVFVYPRQAGKTPVRNFDFQWKYIDILVGPEANKQKAEQLQRTLPPGPTTPGTPVMPGGQSGAQQGGEPSGVPPAPVEPTPSPAQPTPTPPATPPEQGTPIAPPPPSDAPRAQPPVPTVEEPGKPNPWALGPKTGGVRLYFYERETDVASRAAGYIVNTYRYLVDQFNYVPTKTLPYILYNSYAEFLQTNLSPVQEGTLGFTETRGDFRLTLPYFGDHRLFEDVSAHEMAHQFTLQSAEDAALKSGQMGSPLDSVPLWFVEGLAEFYAKRGMDPEGEMLVRDLLINPNVMKGYAMLSFYDEGPLSFTWIYKVGQARCVFLEETYGKGTVQRILRATPQLMHGGGGGLGFTRPTFGFPELVQQITGDNPTTLSLKFDSWLKRRYFPEYLATKQDASMVKVLPETDKIITALNASPDGNLLAYRTIDLTTFDNRLYLTDRRQEGKTWFITGDNKPGVDTLHPVFGRNFDVAPNGLVYVAESNGRDLIFWQRFTSQAEKASSLPPSRNLQPGQQAGTRPEAPPPEWLKRNPVSDQPYRVSLKFEQAEEFNVATAGLISAISPSFSPDGKRVAFIGMNDAGTRDLYVLDEAEGQFKLTQLTHDVYAERALSWGPDGIVYNSDATATGKYNLFKIHPETPDKAEQLTTEARDDLDPEVLPDGRVLFTAYEQGRADIHEVAAGQVYRRTDIATGFFDISPGPDGGVWTLIHYAGERTPVLLTRDKLLSVSAVAQAPSTVAPHAIPSQSLAEAQFYRPFRPENIEIGPIFGFAGGGTGGIAGQLFGQASDKLRNHALLVSIAAYGSFDLTDGFIFYVNQEGRWNWGGGLFQSLSFRVDRSLNGIEGYNPLLLYTSTERFFGATATTRYPFNKYTYAQADLAVGGVSYFLTPGQALLFASPGANGTGRDLLAPWIERNGGVRFQTELTGRLGFDTVKYGFFGPTAGSSLLFEASGTVQPTYKELFGMFRLDGQQYLPLIGPLRLEGRLGLGTSVGSQLARQFYLSSFDTIRGAKFGDEFWLLGRNFVYGTAELVLPLNQLVQVILLNNIQAIAGVDVGSVANRYVSEGSISDPVNYFPGLWDKRVLDLVVGFNFGLGPLLFRLHFAKPMDIGAPVGTPYGGDWVTNFSIGLAGFGGLYGDHRNGALGPSRSMVTPGSAVRF